MKLTISYKIQSKIFLVLIIFRLKILLIKKRECSDKQLKGKNTNNNDYLKKIINLR